jgi:hypothetical protein
VCDDCAQLAALELDVDLEQLTRDVIALEAEQGWSIPGARRPLHAGEVTARVRFAELDRIATDAAGAAARAADDVRRTVLDALADDLMQGATTGDGQAMLARLRQLLSSTNGAQLPGVQAAIDQAARQIAVSLQTAYGDAAGQVAGEAARQGLPDAVIPDTAGMVPTRGEQQGLMEWARRVAEHPVTRVLSTAYDATHRAVRPGEPGDPYEVAVAALDAAEKTSTAGTEDLARQAAGQAHGAGRARAAREIPLEPNQIHSSELLDRQTCGPCATVDGRTYDSMASALEDYPAAGGYIGCQGGARCRGTLVFVWPTESAPTLDVAGDGRSPNEVRPDLTRRGPTPQPKPEPAPSPAPLELDPVLEPTIAPASPIDPTFMNDAEVDQAMSDAIAREDYETAERLAAELDAREAARGNSSVWDQPKAPEDEFWTAPHEVDAPDVAADVVDDWEHAQAGERRIDDDGGEWEFNPAYGWQYVGKGAGKVTKAQLVERIRADWDEYLWSMQSEAEAATRGNFLRNDRRAEFLRQYGSETATASVLFSGPAGRAYYYASRELRDFWEQHPRITYAEFAVERGITDRRTVEAAAKAPGAREDARTRAEEDAEKRQKRQRDAAARRRRRAFTDGTMQP